MRCGSQTAIFCVFPATADSAFGALSSASPWIVLVVLLALLVAALLASRLTHVFLAPITSLDLHDPLKNAAYDELSPLLHRIDRQNRRIRVQMDELRRRQAEFDDITARMDEGLVLFSASGDILFANHAVRRLFPRDSAAGNYLTLCRDAAYTQAVEAALCGRRRTHENGEKRPHLRPHGQLGRRGRRQATPPCCSSWTSPSANRPSSSGRNLPQTFRTS